MEEEVGAILMPLVINSDSVWHIRRISELAVNLQEDMCCNKGLSPACVMRLEGGPHWRRP